MNAMNFHIHTWGSDGDFSVAQIVPKLNEAGIKWFSITDHDSIEGSREAAKLAGELGMRHLDGVELSCCLCDGEIGLDESWAIHILGFGFDLDKMQAQLDRLLAERNERLLGLFNLLFADGFKMEKWRVINNGIKARKYISRELVRNGYAANGDECYEKILNTPRYLPFAKSKPSIREGIDVIHACGGRAVWAHPFGLTRGGKKEITREQFAGLFESMIEYGIDGLEVYYQKYKIEQIQFLAEFVGEYNAKHEKKLLISVGTDYHAERNSLVFDKCELDSGQIDMLKLFL